MSEREKIMKQLEEKTEKRTIELVQKGSNDIGKDVIQIMQDCNQEFEKKVGRPITYSEMRALYG